MPFGEKLRRRNNYKTADIFTKWVFIVQIQLLCSGKSSRSVFYTRYISLYIVQHTENFQYRFLFWLGVFFLKKKVEIYFAQSLRSRDCQKMREKNGNFPLNWPENEKWWGDFLINLETEINILDNRMPIFFL